MLTVLTNAASQPACEKVEAHGAVMLKPPDNPAVLWRKLFHWLQPSQGSTNECASQLNPSKRQAQSSATAFSKKQPLAEIPGLVMTYFVTMTNSRIPGAARFLK